MKMIFTMNIYGGIMILLVLLLRNLFISKVPKSVFKGLWLLTALRLLIPGFIPVHITVEREITDNAPPPAYIYENEPYYPAAADDNEPYAYEAEKVGNASPLLVIWLSGAVAVWCFFAVAYVREIKKTAGAKEICSDEIMQIISSFGLSRKITVKFSGSSNTLLTYGIFKPKIICPANMLELDRKQVAYAVSHEMIHIKNFDAAYKLLITAAVCLNWFDPLVWLMPRLASRDVELACDEELLIRFPNSAADYAETIIAFEEKRNSPSAANALGKSAVEERIGYIMKFKKLSAFSTAFGVCALVCTTAAFAVSAEFEAASKTDSDITNDVIYIYNSSTGVTEISEIEPTDETEVYIVSTYSEPQIKLPPTAGYGDLRTIPEEENRSGKEAVEILESCFEAEDFAYPVDEKYNSGYFYRGCFDIPADKGENVYAMSKGTVIYSDCALCFGNTVIVDHGKRGTWLYCHCGDLCADVGDEVNCGDIIAHVGTTGYTPESKLLIYKY